MTMPAAHVFQSDAPDARPLSGQGPGDRLPPIDVLRLLPGMFVAALDRPWSDTPFGHSGFRIDSETQLGVLRQHCRQVFVDPDCSLPELADAIKAAAVLSGALDLALSEIDVEDSRKQEAKESAGANAASRKPARIASALRQAARNASSLMNPAPKRRDDVHTGRQAREHLRQVLRAQDGPTTARDDGTAARIRRWLRPGTGKAGATLVSGGLQKLRERYGPSIGVIEPAVPGPISEMLEPAAAAHARMVRAIDRLFTQVRLGDIPAIVTLDEPIEGFVDVITKSPDAMRWTQAIYAQRAPRPNPAPAVALNLVIFGRSMGMTPELLHELARIGLLLDLGKVLLPQELLEHPGVLEPKDYALVQQHVNIGLDLLERSQSVSPFVRNAIAQHHERMDGSGYPHRLRGDQIDLPGRMAAIVDTFHGLTAVRAYANPLSVENALSALNEWSNTLFCQELVEHFARATGIFPVGTLVELRSGEVAAVVEQRPGPRPRLRLAMIANADKGPIRDTGDVDARGSDAAGNDAARMRIARGLRIGAWGLRLPDRRG